MAPRRATVPRGRGPSAGGDRGRGGGGQSAGLQTSSSTTTSRGIRTASSNAAHGGPTNRCASRRVTAARTWACPHPKTGGSSTSQDPSVSPSMTAATPEIRAPAGSVARRSNARRGAAARAMNETSGTERSPRAPTLIAKGSAPLGRPSTRNLESPESSSSQIVPGGGENVHGSGSTHGFMKRATPRGGEAQLRRIRRCRTSSCETPGCSPQRG